MRCGHADALPPQRGDVTSTRRKTAVVDKSVCDRLDMPVYCWAISGIDYGRDCPITAPLARIQRLHALALVRNTLKANGRLFYRDKNSEQNTYAIVSFFWIKSFLRFIRVSLLVPQCNGTTMYVPRP